MTQLDMWVAEGVARRQGSEGKPGRFGTSKAQATTGSLYSSSM